MYKPKKSADTDVMTVNISLAELECNFKSKGVFSGLLG